MKDWTDIIGKELESIREPLPADDWQALQQKYTIFRNRKRYAALAWYGGISSIAAIIIIMLIIIRPQNTEPDKALMANLSCSASPVIEINHYDTLSPANTISVISPEIIDKKRQRSNSITHENIEKDQTSEEKGNTAIPTSTENNLFTENHTLKDSISSNTRNIKEKNNNTENLKHLGANLDIDIYPNKKSKNRRVSIGFSGVLYKKDASYRLKFINPSEPSNPDDSLMLQKSALTKGSTSKNNKQWYVYDHKIPISLGLSARFMISQRFAINTGINYTHYISDIKFHDALISTEQNAYYLGIPVRFDMLVLNKNQLNLYIGGGMQVDKCIYVKAGSKKLREKEFIWSISGIAGVQINLTPCTGIYFEPEISTTLNNGTLETFRTEKRTMSFFRAGIRFNI